MNNLLSDPLRVFSREVQRVLIGHKYKSARNSDVYSMFQGRHDIYKATSVNKCKCCARCPESKAIT